MQNYTIKLITTEERCWEEGNYIDGVVVQVFDKYFWLGEDGTCLEADADDY
jgi:hypothetical protein